MTGTDTAQRPRRRRVRTDGNTAAPGPAPSSGPSSGAQPKAAASAPQSKKSQPKATQAKAPKSKTPTTGQWLLGAFILLALIATVLMVVGKNFSITATLAVVSALWAAVIGAILVSRYRRQADVAETRNRDLRIVYELQLEREIAARRQYEASIENQVRADVSAEQNAEFEALKEQVLALRASLEQALGKPLPELPIALTPERRPALGSGLVGAEYTGSGLGQVADDRVAADLDFASTTSTVDSGRHAPTPVQTETPPPSVPAPAEMTDILPVTEDELIEVEQESEYVEVEYAETGHDESEHDEAIDEEPAHVETEYVEYAHAEFSEPEPQEPELEYEPEPEPELEPASVPEPRERLRPVPDHWSYGPGRFASPPPQPGVQQPGVPQTGPQQHFPPRQPATGGFPRQSFGAADYQPPVPPIPAVPPMPQRPESQRPEPQRPHQQPDFQQPQQPQPQWGQGQHAGPPAEERQRPHRPRPVPQRAEHVEGTSAADLLKRLRQERDARDRRQ